MTFSARAAPLDSRVAHAVWEVTPPRVHRHDRRGRRPDRALPAAVAHPRPRLGGYPAPAVTPVGHAAQRHDRTTGRVRGRRGCFRGLRRPGTPHPHGANPRRPHPVGDPPPGSVGRPGVDPSALAFMALAGPPSEPISAASFCPDPMPHPAESLGYDSRPPCFPADRTYPGPTAKPRNRTTRTLHPPQVAGWMCHEMRPVLVIAKLRA